MRFLVDECTGPAVAQWLREQGHDIFSVFDEIPGTNDDTIIRKAFRENRILITNDKDFGEKVYRDNLPHKGVILLRLRDERSVNKIEIIRKLFNTYGENLSDKFVAVTEDQIRFGV